MSGNREGVRTGGMLLAAGLALGLLWATFSGAVGASVAGTPHDFRPDTYSGTGTYSNLILAADGELCRACHVPHNAASLTFFEGKPSRLFPDYGFTNPDPINIILPQSLLCMGCHDGSIAAADGTDTMEEQFRVSPTTIHDRNVVLQHGVYPNSVLLSEIGGSWKVNSRFSATTLPLFVKSGENQPRIACATCHDPHVEKIGGGAGDLFLRSAEPYGDLCVTCHPRQSGQAF